MLPEFRNEPLTDFSDPDQAAVFEEALRVNQRDFGRLYPMVIGGQEVMTDSTFASVNPSRPSDVIAQFPLGDAAHVDQAIEAARCAFITWQHTTPFERAGILHRVAGMMRRRKHEFSATMVLEVGKSWTEADADTAEAIDFLEYYARQILEICDSSAKLIPYPNERGQLVYIPLGVGAIIPPWNFPNAIFTGMTSAAIVSGNTVLVKPADQSPLIAYKVAALFWECGLPDGVLNFLTGPGPIVGGRMVEHPTTRFIAFTGSRAVGEGIYAKAAVIHPGQKWLKRSILELGGKDAVIVDSSADLDAAAAGIVAGAFGFGGQKCSAGSRAVIVDSVYDAVAEKVVALTRRLTVDDPASRPLVGLGPVIDAKAHAKTMSYIEIGMTEGTLLTGGHALSTTNEGYFIEPTVFGEVDPQARIAQEEIFGPVLALIRAKDFDHALHIANDTDYGLTGAVYAKDNAKLEQARREFHVGNLYLNRKITGALVGVNPFGGFNMSGTDSKAGGPDYLLHFTQAKSIAEQL
ncbi:MAG: L-glutamate gamma-semialdehyde dehydrogenase [Chloroflexi bacterium]|nr:L-glutamate gamma-semialdehyde dehydrogenase [Chloroflexota bacterium]